MHGSSANEDADAYGLAPWVAGALVAIFLIVLMFKLAKGFA